MATESKSDEPPMGDDNRLHDIIEIGDEIIDELHASLGTKTEISPKGTAADVLPKLVISKKCLKHVFGMELQSRKKEGEGYKCFGGFHHFDMDTVPKSVQSFRINVISPHVADGYIVVNRTHLPCYKTFFMGSLSREAIMERVVEACQEILQVDSTQPRIWVIDGRSKDGLMIQIIAENPSGKVKTFYPFSKLLKARQAETESMKIQFSKIYCNPCYRESFSTETSICELQDSFGDGIRVGLLYVGLDAASAEVASMFGYVDRTIGLLPRSAVKDLMKTRKIDIKRAIDTIVLPTETIQKCLFDKFCNKFPENICRLEVIRLLKEAINNYVQFTLRIFGEKEAGQQTRPATVTSAEAKTGTAWDDFGGPIYPSPELPSTSRYAMDIMTKNCSVGCMTFGSRSMPMRLPVPGISFSAAENAIIWIIWSNGTCYMDTWSFIVRLNPDTGEIVDFAVQCDYQGFSLDVLNGPSAIFSSLG
jgi:hypothetical protein